MKAKDVHTYLQSLDGGWINWNDTVDTFKAGDPESDITGIAVGWMSYTWALERAKELNCNLFITHEPTYYDHFDQDNSVFRYECANLKKEFIQQSGLAVLRCHDLWDQIKNIGIPDSWGEFLGFSNPIAGEGYYRIYDVTGQTALSVARMVAKQTKSLGQDAVQLVGPADAPVTRVAIGTGAITPFMHFIDQYNVDLAICSDDGFVFWRDGALAIDMNLPVIIVNHAVSELHGIKQLADHLSQRFPDIRVHYIPQTCMFNLIR